MLMAMADGDNSNYDPAPYLAVLPEFEREERDSLKQLQGWYLAVTGAVLGGTAALQAIGVYPHPGWTYAVLAGLALFNAAVVYGSAKWLSFEHSRWQLYHSGIAGTLARGDLAQRDIYNYVHPAFRWLFKPADRLSPKQQLRCIARHLYWYLYPPRRYLSELLYALPVLIAGFLLILFLAVNSVGQYEGLHLLPILAMLVLLGFCINIVDEVNKSTHLVQYLRWQWIEQPEPTAREPAVPDPTTQLCLILNRLEQDLRFGAAMLQHYLQMATVLFMTLLTFLIVGPVVVALGYSIDSWGAILISIAFAWICVTQLEHWFTHRCEAGIRAKLANADLALRIAYGNLNYHDIEDYIPWPFQVALRFPLMPRGYGDDLRRMVWRVAFNLDWYLGPPRRLLRASWVAVLSSLILVPALIGLLFIMPKVIVIRSGLLLIFGLFTLTGLLIYRDCLRWQAWQRVLVLHLRARLATDGMPPRG